MRAVSPKKASGAKSVSDSRQTWRLQGTEGRRRQIKQYDSLSPLMNGRDRLKDAILVG
jgi:hypothetical protein